MKLEFEWDEKKNELNIKKHGIDFNDVPTMFQYPLLTGLDIRQDYGEYRWIGIGTLRNRVIVIIFTERTNNKIRLISARKANRYERQKYQEAIKNQLEQT